MDVRAARPPLAGDTVSCLVGVLGLRLGTVDDEGVVAPPRAVCPRRGARLHGAVAALTRVRVAT